MCEKIFSGKKFFSWLFEIIVVVALATTVTNNAFSAEIVAEEPIDITEVCVILKVGKTITLTVTDGNNTFSSSNDSVATVDANGIVTGIADGFVTITGTDASDNTDIVTVTVYQERKIALPPRTSDNTSTTATFSACATTDDEQTCQDRFAATDSISIWGTIKPESAHVGMTGSTYILVMEGSSSHFKNVNGAFKVYKGDLEPATVEILGSEIDINIIEDIVPADFGLAGRNYEIYIGYSLDSDPEKIYFNSDGLDVSVSDIGFTDPNSDTVLLAAYQAWHGLSSHNYPPYSSDDPLIIAQQIERAQAMGIDGFVVNWYGPESGGTNEDEVKNRKFIDQATAKLFEQAEVKKFSIALMYDEGAVWDNAEQPDTKSYMPRIQTDLAYAKKYFDSSAYLQINNNPALFIFPYDSETKEVDRYIDWAKVRNELGVQITLLDKDPNPPDLAHDDNFDGFYAWVQATNGDWRVDGTEWGEDYLNWFYDTMRSCNADKVMVGGVWPGFDDLLAQWSENRFISRRDGQTYDDTMNLAKQNDAPFIMIDTWNDFEEGTDIEFGKENVIDFDDDSQELFITNNTYLLRSWPLKIRWDSTRVPIDLHFYKDGMAQPIYNQVNPSPEEIVQLQSGGEYEVKLWTSGNSTISRWLKIRGQDHIPGIEPTVVDSWSFDWTGDKIVSDTDFYDTQNWTLNLENYDQGDRIDIISNGSSLQLVWTLGSADRYKFAQSYIRLSSPLNLAGSDIIGLDLKGTDIKKIDGSDVVGKVGFELKFEDGSNPSTHAVMKWSDDNIGRLDRWANKISALKKQFTNTDSFDWSNIRVVSLAIYADPSTVDPSEIVDITDITGVVTIRNLISSNTSTWEKAIAQEFIDPSNYNQIKINAINALINRQNDNGLLTTWTKDQTAWLYGQGLALKALTIDGIWDAQNSTNPSAIAAEKLALFLANNQENGGYWPRTWDASTGEIINHLENNNTIWMGDFPWPLIGLQSYYKKTADERVRPAIENALQFIKNLINENGELSTLNVQTNEQQPVTSNEAYAAVLLSLYESNETELAGKMWNYILSHGWDSDLRVWKEGTDLNSYRLVLFANTWLAPFLVEKGRTQMALDSLSLVGKALYTNGPGAPYGLDGFVPLAVWYEGTLSYISAGGPGSIELFNNLKDFINNDGTVPHYNDNFGSIAGIWAVDWASLDGTSWLYFVASGISPFDTLEGTPVMN